MARKKMVTSRDMCKMRVFGGKRRTKQHREGEIMRVSSEREALRRFHGEASRLVVDVSSQRPVRRP